jgi:hypothetical protein
MGAPGMGGRPAHSATEAALYLAGHPLVTVRLDGLGVALQLDDGQPELGPTMTSSAWTVSLRYLEICSAR